MGIAEDIIIIILAGLVSGFIAHKLKLPMFLGYIVAGIIVGPFTGGITVTNVKQIEFLAEIGVALLLFSIGLDLSFREIREVRRIALIGTPIQLFLTIVFGYSLGIFFGFTHSESLLLGAIISLSSTMIVIKNLMTRGLTGTLSARVMTGILIVQDLAAVPMMIMIPRISTQNQGLYALGLTLLKGIIVLAMVVIFGTRIVPYLLKQVSKLNSRELFMLAVTSLGLGIGYLTHLAGLSFALGAFVTGMMLNGSDYSHKALNDIIPLRDIFGLIFFTSVGMLIDPFFLMGNIKIIAMLVSLIIFGKFIIFALLSRSFGYFNIIPLAVGLGLSQVGEFSFVLARIGLNEKLLTERSYLILLTASVASMILSPLLSMLTSPMYSLKNRFFKKDPVKTVNYPAEGLSDHVVIAGGGRVGRNIASILRGLGFVFVIIEEDFSRFEISRNEGFPVIYGDAGQDSVMSAAEIKKSRMLIITIPILASAREIIESAVKINPGLRIIARSESIEGVRELYKMKVYEAVQPEFEASLEMIRQSLAHLDIPVTAIQKYTDEVRRRQYAPLESMNSGMLSSLKNASLLLDISWFQVFHDSPSANRSIKEMEIRTKTGASVVGVYRCGEFRANPDGDFIFLENDLIAVIGTGDSMKSFEKLIRPGV